MKNETKQQKMGLVC